MVVSGLVLASGDDALGPLNDVRLVDHAASALRGSGVVDFVVVGRGSSAHACLHDALVRLDGVEVVVLHDAGRPLAPASLVTRVVEAVLAGADAALPVVEVTETVKEVDGGRIVRTVPRETLVQVQTPQAVRWPLLAAAHRSCRPGDPLVPRSTRTVTVPGEAHAFPVRTPADLALAAAVLATST
jgi:2-C-methyl-D-erythritol 4-phosphate cytidylyltransferase